MSEPADASKIIVDEDWKTQVQAEKARHEHERAAKQTVAKSPDHATERPARHGPLPPPTLGTLISTLATQSLLGLGQIAHPSTGKPEVNLDEARHFIDLLQMLEAKTANHRTPEESGLLDNVLHELRMAFVAVQADTGKQA